MHLLQTLYRNAFVGMENIHEIALSDKKQTNRRTRRPPNSLHITFECHHNCGSPAKGLQVGLLGLTPAAAGSDLYFSYAYCCSCPKMYLCSFYPELQYGIEDKIDETLNPESYVKRRCWKLCLDWPWCLQIEPGSTVGANRLFPSICFLSKFK